MPSLTLSPSAIAKIQRPVRGRGGFQTLLRRLQKQIQGDTLTLSDDDLEKLIRYSYQYGEGGFEDRTRAPQKKR